MKKHRCQVILDGILRTQRSDCFQSACFASSPVKLPRTFFKNLLGARLKTDVSSRQPSESAPCSRAAYYLKVATIS